ncbi:uncharacterized protein [Fopius arisanus]|uniref:Uncharacterized protein n=1 Tax=Fopius arisanus TaxID=64838 RepID=A0A9R1TSG6_9HYME|nr:PREDICTED: uncharacterized protein LOC105263159 [Fopius arisanus]XP_011297491.1 PREDICTED: uncharacterized protein LOC105263159 [Fopius arisanus]
MSLPILSIDDKSIYAIVSLIFFDCVRVSHRDRLIFSSQLVELLLLVHPHSYLVTIQRIEELSRAIVENPRRLGAGNVWARGCWRRFFRRNNDSPLRHNNRVMRKEEEQPEDDALEEDRHPSKFYPQNMGLRY